MAPGAGPASTATAVASHGPTRRRGRVARAVALACVVLASTVLVAVLGLIGYRHSGWSHPALDRVLVALGTPPLTSAADARLPSAAEPSASRARAPAPAAQAPLGEARPEPDERTDEPAPAGGILDDPEPRETADAAGEAEPSGETAEDAIGEDAHEAEPADGATERAAPDGRAGEAPAASEAVDEPGAGSVADLLERADRAGSSELAERLYRRVLELDPREHHAMVGLGRLLLERGAHAEAAEQFRAAVRRRPRRAAYRIWLGDALAGAGDAAGARREWEEALALEPDNRQARERLGR